MEGPRDGTMGGCPTSTHEQHASTNTSTTEQKTLPPTEESVEGNILTDTLNQLLHEPMALDQTMSFLDDPTGLLQSTLGVDNSLLASLDPGTTFSASIPPAPEPVQPAVAGVGTTESSFSFTAPVPARTVECSNEPPLYLPPHPSSSELAELNLSQLASSIIDSASVAAPSLGAYPVGSGSIVSDDSSVLGLSTEPDMTGNLMDQISPPMVLPDLNLAMAEGMAASHAVEEKKEAENDGLLKGTNKGVASFTSTIDQQYNTLSVVTAPLEKGTFQTSGVQVNTESMTADPTLKGSSSTPALPPQQSITASPSIVMTSLASGAVTEALTVSSESVLSEQGQGGLSIPLSTLQTSSSLTSVGSSLLTTPSSSAGSVATQTAAAPSTAAAQTSTGGVTSTQTTQVTIHQMPSTSSLLSLPSHSTTTSTLISPVSTFSAAGTAPKVAPALPLSQSTPLSLPSTSSGVSFPPPSAITPLARPTTSAIPSPAKSVASLSSSASTSQTVNPAAVSMLAKGLNLPLLQFLNLNFPSLKIKDLQDVLSINALLAQVLKQQINTDSAVAAQQQSAESAKVSTTPRVAVSISTTTPLQSGTLDTKSLSTRFLQPKSNVLSSSPTLGARPVVAPRSATQTGLFVPSTPLGASSATLSKAASSQTSSLLTSSSEVKGMQARPVRSDGQPMASQSHTGASNAGINVDLLSRQSSSLLSTLASPASLASNRKAVLVQILNKTSSQQSSTSSVGTSSSLTSSPLTTTHTRSPVMVPRMTPLSKSPLILNRHGRTQNQVVRTTLASLSAGQQSTPPSSKPSSLCVSLSLPSLRNVQQGIHHKRKTPTRKSHLLDLGQQLSRTVVQPAESEAMEVDVGQPIQRLALPKHLKDHSYSLYNPEEGEKLRQSDAGFTPVSSIPPARLSYAPQVPDSPSTLHKLLKVLPKKNSRQSVPMTPPYSLNRASGGRVKGRGGRKSGSRGGSKSRIKVGGAKKIGYAPTSQASSEDESRASSSDQSDSEESRKNRRRSQRNAGQRKRYIDDLNLPISDDELMEDVMSSRPPRKKDYKGYGNQEEDDMEGWGAGGGGDTVTKDKLCAKHKSRTISINPTEGFQYSDVYFEPPAEEANLVDRVLSHRVREAQTEEERVIHGDTVEEFFVKYKNYSYLHCEWAIFDKLLRGDRRFDGKVKRYKAKQASLGIFSNVDDEPFNPEYTEVDRALDVATQTEPNGEIVTHYLVKWKSLPYEDATWELEEDIDKESIATFNRRQMLPSAKELSFVPRPPPASFKPVKERREYKDSNFLRSYQREGLNWLVFNWYARQNCILADEMGLGKTVQSIAFLIEVFNARIRGPFLVIVPLSTIGNWQREFETWSSLNVVIYHGSAYSRRLIHEYDLYYRDSRGKIIGDTFKFNVIVTTYEVMLSDDSELQNIDWRVVIIDEAHRLKNRNCKLLEGLKRLSMEHRVLLTGTPLQNSVEELFSLLNFLEPHTFPSHVSFLQQFGDLKTEEQVEELKTILKPMMLRRLKEDVEKSIAPKEETIIEVELTAIQKQYYRAILERNFMFLSKGSSAPTTAIPSLLNVMMELRKCCNHPFLIKGAEHKIVSDWQAQRPSEPVYNSLIQASGKLVLIDKLLPKLKESGHKVLIFSQMVRCLDILEDYLRMKGYFYERIDGQVRGTLRQEAIDRFSKPDTDRFVFLLCTRAGGLGINLTAADTVIIYDSDWNPQNDIQAQARCHRIGQNKPVKVYRLITRNSYEREMFDRASLKLGLDKAVLHSVTTSQQTTGPPQLSKKEIEDLLKKGAYGALMEGNDDDANRFCEEDIDQILEQRAHVVQLESEGKGSTFSKASFVADESSDINIDDPDFWQKWAEKARLDLDELANKDNLVLDTPRQRRQVRRYGNDHLQGEIVDMIDPKEDVIPSRGRHGWTKIELFKTEKWMLIYGWGQWKDILGACDFRKRQLGVGDVENISRTILIYCLAHFKGDERIPPYIHRLIDPSEITETGDEAESQFSHFTEDDYLALLSKNPETLFQDEGYMKHLRRHAHKIIFRIRQLHIIRWQMLVDYKKQIMKGMPAKSLGLQLPRPEESPPAPWWNTECDHSLVVGILKHGYEQFHLFRLDPALCFKALVGEEPPGSRKKKKSKPPSTKERGEEEEEEEEVELDFSGEESDDESAPSTPGLSIRLPNSRKSKTIATNTPGRVPSKPGMYVWPTLADVNTRARRLVSAWVKHQKKEEQKQVHLIKERVKREKEAEVSRKKELKKAELAQKWSKREEQDFARVITFFGVIFDPKANKYSWMKFRQLASLSKKSDERLTLYLHDFQQMCRRVVRKKRIRRGLSGIRVEPVNEERAIRCLQRIDLLSAVRLEILPHPDFDLLIELCEQSFEVPSWWLPATHDRDLLRGVTKHGLYRSDQLIYNDPELCFKQTVPQTALFDPATNQVAFPEEDEESGSEDEDGPKLRSSIPGSNPVPLGWPKEKAIAIRITRIAYAFRNRVWPKPMEGLDLFNPTISDESSEDSSLSEVESEGGGRSDSDFEVVTTRSKRKAGLTVHISSSTMGRGRKVGGVCEGEDNMVDVVGVGDQTLRDFEIERQQGLKMTLKKSTHIPTSTKSKASTKKIAVPAKKSTEKLEIKIPLVKLSFASKAGLKRIPKKRPAERGTNESPDTKRQKAQTSTSGIDLTKVNFADLTGQERVGVINRNTNERLPLKQSPMLKNLKLWLEGHPHFNVDPQWGPLAIEWGALKPEMYHRVLIGDCSEHDSNSML